MPTTSFEAREKKRAYDREQKRIQRAGMTLTERADARRENDRLYRDRHRAERQEYDRERGKRLAKAKWN